LVPLAALRHGRGAAELVPVANISHTKRINVPGNPNVATARAIPLPVSVRKEFDQIREDGARFRLDHYQTEDARVQGGFAASVGARHAIAVGSCTAAITAGSGRSACNRGDGDPRRAVYLRRYRAEVVRCFDARPVFVDASRAA